MIFFSISQLILLKNILKDVNLAKDNQLKRAIASNETIKTPLF
jgi:hypothetical protein